MKTQLPAFMKSFYLLTISLLLGWLSSLTAKLPTHASLLPENPFLLITVHPRQLMEKANHQSLINKPTVASLYASSSSNGLFDNYEENEEFEQFHGMFTRLMEHPAETSGIDLDHPVFLALPGVAKLEIQFIAKLKDPEKFENFLPILVRSKKQWQDTDGGNRAFIHDSNSIVIHDSKSVILKGTFKRQENLWVKEADQWFEKKEVHLPNFLTGHLSKSPDAGVYLSLAPVLPFFAQRLEVGQSPPEHLKDTHLFLAINSMKGSIVADLNTYIGEKTSIQLGTTELDDAFFDFLDQDSLLKATLSINLVTAFEHLMHVLPFTGMDTEEFAEEIQEAFNIDYKEIPEFFTGQAAFSITGMVFEEEEFEFLAAIGTKIPAAEVYVKIIQKGLLGALKGDTPRNNNPLGNLSIVAKENLLLIASRNHANLLESGKVAKPMKKEEITSMKTGLFNLLLDFPKLLKSLEKNSKEFAEDKEFQFVTQRVLPAFQSFDVKSRQNSKNTYQTSYTLSFRDKEHQGLQTLTHHIADLFNPHLRNPKTRHKLITAEAKLKKEPDAFHKAIIGTWHGNLPEPPDHTAYKLTVSKDGTQQYEEIYISQEGWSRSTDSGTWSIHGTTYKDYEKEGGLAFVATILDVNDSTLTYVDYFDIYEEEVEPTVENRVNPEFQLPKPPKGLKELDEGRIYEEIEVEK